MLAAVPGFVPVVTDRVGKSTPPWRDKIQDFSLVELTVQVLSPGVSCLVFPSKIHIVIVVVRRRSTRRSVPEYRPGVGHSNPVYVRAAER
jgi:hypothetical protein